MKKSTDIKPKLENDNDVEMDEDDGADAAMSSTNKSKDTKGGKKVYIPNERPLKDGEELTFDTSAYQLYEEFETGHPCLSFDTIIDGDGDDRQSYPLTFRLVAGTQAPKSRDNKIIVMKVDNLTALKKEDEDLSDDENDDGDNENGSNPRMCMALITHHGGINRIRAQNIGSSTVCAVWNDQAKVQIWNISDALKTVNDMQTTSTTRLNNVKPIYSFVGHQSEGFAIDWSSLKTGQLASGDTMRRIHIWHMGEGGQWTVDQRPLAGHLGSIEDLQWSPIEESLLSSCSSDCSIRLWDIRSPPTEACVRTIENAHDSHVNVISWNRNDGGTLIVSGGDEGQLKVWDLRSIQTGQPVARFKYHTKPITSVEWSPAESTVFMASAEDDQTTIWDLALELDDIADNAKEVEPNVPPQLLFIHMGQKEVKEVHWHRQLPGLAITTALTGFNLFRSINM